MAARKKTTRRAPRKDAPGKVLKVITVDEQGEPAGEWSKQLPSDPFGAQYKYAGLVEPPFSLEQLLFLAEQHPTHGSALDQKAVDVTGQGWEWTREEEDDKGDENQKKQLEEWFRELANGDENDETNHEVLTSAWNDLETIGHGLIEVARDTKGEVRHWFHVPAHTCRFHKDGIRIAQIRDQKRRWFKRWIPGDERWVNFMTGKLEEKGGGRKKSKNAEAGNEMIVLKRASRRSSYYGIPQYMTAVGWIVLSTAARDDNILFFHNRREPRWAVILSNVEENPELESKIRTALQTDLKSPHRNLLIPLAGNAEIKFEKLGDTKNDMSFEKLQDRSDTSILMSHRMPGERLGLIRSGPLGGNQVTSASRVYKEAVVQTSQALLKARINKFVEFEGPVKKPKWNWEPTELDLTEEGADLDRAVTGFQGGVLKLDESRGELGRDEVGDERGDKFFFELAPEAAAAAAQAGFGPAGDQGQLQGADQRIAAQIEQLLGPGGRADEGGSTGDEE